VNTTLGSVLRDLRLHGGETFTISAGRCPDPEWDGTLRRAAGASCANVRHLCALMRLVTAEASKVVCYVCLPRIGMREVEFVYGEGVAITAENRQRRPINQPGSSAGLNGHWSSNSTDSASRSVRQRRNFP